MAERTDTSVRINGTRKAKLDKASIELTILNKKIVKMSDIVNHLIDNYLSEAKKDLQHKRNKEDSEK